MQEAKISTVEAYYLIVFAIMADLVNWIPIVNILTTVVTLPVFQFYFRIKGVKSMYSLAGNLAEVIPFVSVLPAITAGVLVTIIVDWKSAGKGIQSIKRLTSGTKKLASVIPVAK